MKVPPFRKNAFYPCLVLLSISCASAQTVRYQDPGQPGNPESWRSSEFTAEWGLGAMKAQYAYSAGYTGKSIAIGVLDSGVYDKHPELPASRFLPVVSNGISGALNKKNDAHGTLVSGTIGAARDGQGMHGVAFDATVYEANTNATDGLLFGVSDPGFPDSDTKYLAAAYDALAAKGVRIINNSWGSQPGSENYSTLSNIVDAYRQHKLANNGQGTWLEAAIKVSRNGVVNNFSAGNTGFDNASMRGSLPSFQPELEGRWMTTTGYAQQQGQVYNKCGIAKYWCVAAPTGALSTKYAGGPPGTTDPKATYDNFNGTSAAAPHASAALALIMERYPYMTNEQALAVLFTTSQNMEVDASRPIIKNDPLVFKDITPLRISSSKLPNAVVGWGLVDLQKAMNGPAQFLGRFDYNLPGGQKDIWSNDISQEAMVQRKMEEQAEVDGWSVKKATLPGGLPSDQLAVYLDGLRTDADSLLKKLAASIATGKFAADYQAVQGNPVAASVFSRLLAKTTYGSYLDGYASNPAYGWVARSISQELTAALAAKSFNIDGDVENTRGSMQFEYATANDRVAFLTKKLADPTAYEAGLAKNGDGTLTLTGNNSYSGGTLLQGGTLGVGSSTALGTGKLVMSDATTLQAAADGLTLANAVTLNGIGNIDTQAYGLTLSGAITDGAAPGGFAKLGAGALILSGVNTYSGPTGVMNGTLRAGSATGFSTRSAFFVDTQGQLDLDSFDQTIGSLFGSGSVLLGTATLTTGADNSATTFSGQIAGSGGLVKTGSGDFTLAGTSTYSGATVVTAGTLQAGAANAFGAASAMTVNMGATLNLAGYDQRIAGMNLAGTVSLAGAKLGTTLTVTGPWAGNGGLLKLGTVSTAVSDRVLLSGATAVASGTTTVQFGNVVGLGAATAGNGVEVIGTTEGASVQGGAFVLAGGQLTGGAYEYRLNNIGSGVYLSSSTPLGQVYYRSEVPQFAALSAQLRQASLAMLGNMHQRAGDDDAKTANANQADGIGDGGRRRAWGRTITSNLDIRQSGTVSPESRGRLDGFQAGTDLLHISNWRAGVYVGQLDGDMRVSGFARGIRNLGVGSNSVRNQYLGAYGTYTGEGGFYADAVLQAGRHRYDLVNLLAQSGSGGSGKARSLLASVEVGRPFALGGAGDWKVEPQLQLIHQRLNLDDVAITGNTLVRQRPDNAWLARVGVRIKGEVGVGAGRLQPYSGFNLYRASGGNDVSSFIASGGRAAITSSTGGTSAELTAGATLALTPTFALYSEFGKLWSTGGSTRVKTSVQAGVGARILW